MSTLPAGFKKLILPFACLFSKRVFQSVQVLLAGAVLAPGKRTVTSVLRIMGLSQERHFHLPPGIESRRMVQPGGQPYFAATPGARLCPRGDTCLRDGRHD